MNDISEYKILIIQNTPYHFETTISLYSSLKRLNPKKLDIIQIIEEYTNQKEFLTNNNISYIDMSDMSQFSYDIAFVVSAYPNPHVKLNDSIPNIQHGLFEFYVNRMVYVCHRFDNKNDYTIHPRINFKNALSLSKLSKNIGLDFFYPIEYQIQPKLFTDTIPIFSIQGHFELKNRIILNNRIFSCSSDFIINFIGTSLPHQQCENHKLYSNLNETDFYITLNNCKFLFPMIDDKIKNHTYTNQRFSSNFNHAMALEKPIFAHESFKHIYEIPGIYYNATNIEQQFDQLLHLNDDEYHNMIDQFKQIKNRYYQSNSKTLSQKIYNVLNNV